MECKVREAELVVIAVHGTQKHQAAEPLARRQYKLIRYLRVMEILMQEFH
tara:strand:+ start:557 stop:706 length:150 start_codon:yes stop_codon:yes gene_type:complete